MQYLQRVNNNLQRDRSAAHARWNVESAENQTAICLGEDGWTVLVLRSAAAIPSSQPGLRLEEGAGGGGAQGVQRYSWAAATSSARIRPRRRFSKLKQLRL